MLKSEIKDIECAQSAELNSQKKILASIEQKKRDLAYKVNMKKLKVKEKSQEEKLSDLKAKELKRAVPFKKLKPLKRNQSQSERSSNLLETKVDFNFKINIRQILQLVQIIKQEF